MVDDDGEHLWFERKSFQIGFKMFADNRILQREEGGRSMFTDFNI